VRRLPPGGATLGDGHPRLSVLFPRKACRECEDRLKCTGNVEGKGHHILLLPEFQQKIQSQVRKDQKTRRPATGSGAMPSGQAARPLSRKRDRVAVSDTGWVGGED
jgi:hypothetical protein